MKKIIRTQLTYLDTHTANDFEVVPNQSERISATVPDMGLSLRELIDLNNKGRLSDIKTPHYFDEHLPDVAKMDIADIYEMKDQAQETAQQIADKLKSKGFKISRKRKN